MTAPDKPLQNDGLTRLRIRQARWMDGYRFEVRDQAGQSVGEIIWPMLAQARNARLRPLGADDRAGRPVIRIGSADWTVAFDYLDRGWANDTRYQLMAPGERCAAEAEMRFARGRIKAGVLSLTTPVAARFVRTGWLKSSFELQTEAGCIGRIGEPRLFSLTRALVAELPSTLPTPAQLFVIFLACHLIQGN